MQRVIKSECRSAHLLKKNGSLLFCGNCDMIIGSINCEGYDFIDLRVICRCKNVISVKNRSTTAKPFNRSNIHSILLWHSGVYICRKCGRKVLSIVDERVFNYSFNLICRCGEQYDSINNFRRRLGETMETLHDEPEFLRKNKNE